MIREATPSTVAAVLAQSIRGDAVRLAAGVYGALPSKAGVIMEAVDWQPGRVIRDTVGHLGQGMAVTVRAIENTPDDDITVRGIFYDQRPFTSINAHLIGGNNMTLEDCSGVDRNASRKIGITVGAGNDRTTGFRFIRSRYHFSGVPGQVKDHPLYLKNTSGWLVDSSLIYDAGNYALHLYTDADNGRMTDSVIWGCGHGVTFSGALDTSTGASVYGTSDGNVIEGNIIGNGKLPGYLIESWTSDPLRPVVGNIVRDNLITRGGGVSGLIKPGIAGVTLSGNVDKDPGFRDPANGDFRRSGAYDGYGPAALFGEIIDPPPPPSDPCASIRATLAQTVSDLAGAREARDQAIESSMVAIAERDVARIIALELKARIDAAKAALG